MAPRIIHFLLVYDRAKDELVQVLKFEDYGEATSAYEAAERCARAEATSLDVVLVGAESLEAVKVTHSNYFNGNAMRRIRELLAL